MFFLLLFFTLSLIKYDFFDYCGGIHYKNTLAYHAVRLILLGMVVFIMFATRTHFSTQSMPLLNDGRPVDAYANLRADYDPLLGLRSVAFLMVFLGHWFIVVFPPVDAPHSVFIRALFSASPWGGVWVFFCLSGYLMGKCWITEKYRADWNGAVRFYKNRAFRIFPLYFLAIFVITLLKKPDVLNFSSADKIENFLSDVLFDSSGHGAIGALWSVTTEFQFYLGVPFLYVFFSKTIMTLRRGFIFILSCFLLMGLLKYYGMTYWPFYWHRHVYMPLLSNIDIFLTGYTMAIIVNLFRQKEMYFRYGMQSAVLIGVLYYSILSYVSYLAMLQNPAF